HDSVGNDVEARHRKEAQEAEEAARKRLLQENPDMTEEELRIKLPEDQPAGKRSVKPRAPRRRNRALTNRVPPSPARLLENPPPLPLNHQPVYHELAAQREPALLFHG